MALLYFFFNSFQKKKYFPLHNRIKFKQAGISISLTILTSQSHQLWILITLSFLNWDFQLNSTAVDSWYLPSLKISLGESLFSTPSSIFCHFTPFEFMRALLTSQFSGIIILRSINFLLFLFMLFLLTKSCFPPLPHPPPHTLQKKRKI